MRTNQLVKQFGGKLPAGVSKADAETILQFLYGAFDKQAARSIKLFFPYSESDTGEILQLSVLDFCRWLSSVA
jgi:hypothetical protein